MFPRLLLAPIARLTNNPVYCISHSWHLEFDSFLRLIVQLTVNPLKETELVLYGGEFYNGNKVRLG